MTAEEALSLLAGRVEQAWLDELRSTPDGEALLQVLIDLLAAVDQEDIDRASQLWLNPTSTQLAPPAQGPRYASLQVRVTLRRTLKTTRPITLPAGSPLTTPDGHVFLTDAPLTWGVGEVGVAKAVLATAALPGRRFVPPGELRAFVPVVEGLGGGGLAVELLPGGLSQPKALRLRTNLAIPHAFLSDLVGRYIELFDTVASANEGRALLVAKVNDGSSFAAAGATENEYAWSETTDTTVDAWMAPWALGASGFSWRALDWNDLFAVENTTAAEGGGLGLLDELALAVRRPRQEAEGDEALRTRLALRGEPPSPLGMLRAAIRALVNWGFGRLDVRLYEMGQPPPDGIDSYAFNFPAAMGFISDLHCTDMLTPETPDGMASVDSNYAPLSPFFNPGLALLEPGTSRWMVIVRWDPPVSMPAATVATVRRLLFSAVQVAKQGGCVVQLYFPEQWSYPP